MKIIEKLKRNTRPAFAFEIIPSVSGSSLRDILETVEHLMPFDPQWINVPSHAQNAFEVCGAIYAHFRVPTVAHVLCRGYTTEQTEEALEELSAMGVENLLLLRGEIPEFEKARVSGTKSYADTVALVKEVCYSPFNFCVGVAGYPEKHIESTDLVSDVEYLKKKVDAGAHYVLTQMFFDNQLFYDFVERCRAAGIQVPIIPGLRILTSLKHLSSIPERFHVTLPPQLVEEVLADPERAEETGMRWAEAQGRDLIQNGHQTLHFFVMHNVQHVKQVVESLMRAD